MISYFILFYFIFGLYFPCFILFLLPTSIFFFCCGHNLIGPFDLIFPFPTIFPPPPLPPCRLPRLFHHLSFSLQKKKMASKVSLTPVAWSGSNDFFAPAPVVSDPIFSPSLSHPPPVSGLGCEPNEISSNCSLLTALSSLSNSFLENTSSSLSAVVVLVNHAWLFSWSRATS